MCGPCLAHLRPVPSQPRLAYAATTPMCTFFLDEEGFCRKVDLAAKVDARAGRAARGCVGTQYVASLDPASATMLAELPRAGASMLFAKVDERGRVALLRTGVVSRFLRLSEEALADMPEVLDPFAQTDGVRTSAPPVLPRPVDLDDAPTEQIPALGLAHLAELDGFDGAEDAITVHIPRGDGSRSLVGADDAEDDDLRKTAEYRRAQ